MFGKKKEKKKKQRPETISSLTANGTEIQVINFALTKNDDGSPRLEVRTPDVCEALHFSHVDFELKTKLEMLRVSANFKEAKDEKRFKLYIFDVDDVAKFYI